MAPPPRPPPPPPPPAPSADPAQMKMDISLGGSERVGGRQRDKSQVYAAESEALDQIAKEAESRLAARRKARYEARNIRLKELEKKKEAEANAENIANTNGTSHTTTTSNYNTSVTPNINTNTHTTASTNHHYTHSEASFVIQNEKKEATRSLANNFEVSKISDKDGKEIPLCSSTELSGQEKQRTSDVITGRKNIEDLRLESYSKNELIQIIEFSLLSYVEGLKNAKVNHSSSSKEESSNHFLETGADTSLSGKNVVPFKLYHKEGLQDPPTNQVPCSKKELKKQRQREQRQKQPNTNLLNANMANHNGASQSGKGWDRLVNPVQELGRSLLNFLVGGNATNSTAASNRQNSSGADGLSSGQYPFSHQTKPDKSDVRQLSSSNPTINPSTPTVLRRSSQAAHAKTPTFSEEQVQMLQSPTNSVQVCVSVPEKHDSDLVAFAVQDNSAAVHSPPVLLPPNVNRRKKKKEKIEIKASNKSEATDKGNKEPSTNVSQLQESASKVAGNDKPEYDSVDSTNRMLSSDDNTTVQNAEEIPIIHHISFNNVIQRLSRSDLEDVKIEQEPEKEHPFSVQNNELANIPDTPKPSFRKIQERLKSSEDCQRKEIEVSSETLQKVYTSQNITVEPKPSEDTQDEVLLGAEFSNNPGKSQSSNKESIKEPLKVPTLPENESSKLELNNGSQNIDGQTDNHDVVTNCSTFSKKEDILNVSSPDQKVDHSISVLKVETYRVVPKISVYT